MANKRNVQLYTDGACKGNPGPGGWAVILLCHDVVIQLSGYDPDTTNNRMELQAVIEGLRALREPYNVQIISDSQYICDAINKGWLASWQKDKWVKSNKKPVLNVDLWQELLPLLSFHNVEFIWVKGHSGDQYNTICDKLAVAEYQKHS
ncbi:MAG: ribonuclease HI [Candidatus Gastranaerophilaceae bacterium]